MVEWRRKSLFADTQWSNGIIIAALVYFKILSTREITKTSHCRIFFLRIFKVRLHTTIPINFVEYFCFFILLEFQFTDSNRGFLC